MAVYSIGKEKRYAVYRQTGINDWYIFNVVPGTVVEQTIVTQNRLGTISIGTVALCALLLLVIMAWRERHRIMALKKLQNEQLLRLSTDPVTGLLSAQGFTHAVEEMLRTLPQGQFCAMLDFSIVNFNQYNASFGSDAVDAVLRGVAETLVAKCRVKQPCARLSADRFACFVIGCESKDELMERIIMLDKELHAIEGAHQLQIAYGVYILDDWTLPVDELYDRAVAARLTADENTYHIGFYDQVIHQRQIEDAMLVERMDEGLRLGQFVAYYQPKYDTHTERIVGAEALVRWIREDGKTIPPDRFIRLFEQNGLITKLDLFMFERVCQKLASMENPIQISVNFSRMHLYDTELADKLWEITSKYGVASNLLEIELTETAFFDRRDALIFNMNKLRERGFSVSLDEFGSGFSSLNTLKDVYFDTLKIDKEFLSETTASERGQKVIKSVFALANSLKVQTVAEGVETAEQLEVLRENGCDIIQGYYFSRPLPEAEFDRLLHKNVTK